MQVRLYHIGIECRQILRWNIVRMLHNLQLGMLRVEPQGEMPPCDEVHVVHPWCKLLHTSEPVLQVIPVPKPVTRIAIVCFLGAVHILLLQPRWVITIHPQNYKIYLATSYIIIILCKFPYELVIARNYPPLATELQYILAIL